MTDSIDKDHPLVWYDDLHAGCWWGQGHLTPEQFAQGARAFDSDYDVYCQEGYTVEHLWRTSCVEGEFQTDTRPSEEYPHPVSRLR